MPLRRPDGSVLGTLCALDPSAAELPESCIADLELMATLIQHELAEQERRRTRDRWMGILAHDLRTPLHNIRITTEVLARQLSGAGRLRDQVHRNIDRMSEMITSIMDYAKTTQQVGSVPLERTSIDLVPWLRTELEDRNASATLDYTQGDHPVHLNADPDRLAQALGNLFDNAKKHSTDGTFRVRVDERSGCVRVSVTNRVEGPVPNDLGGLFDPFVRGPTAAADGVGLGLFLARSTMRAHGGDLACHWDAGEATFWCELPTA